MDYIYIAGSSVIIAEMNETNNQRIVRGHDDEVTCMAFSRTGKYLATGQKGDNSDILVWAHIDRKLLYKFSEHDFEVTALEFSQDETLLVSVSNVKDGKLFVWDVTTGYIYKKQYYMQ